MLRHTCAWSGRSRTRSVVALRMTFQPSSRPAFCASRRVATGRASDSSIPYAASSSVSASSSRSTPSGLAASARPITCWAVAGSTASGSGAAPSGVRSHTAYSTTRASARTAASTAG